MPAEANSPPTSITGRQPKRVTRMLDTGPVGRAESPPSLLHSPAWRTLQALHLSAPEDGSKGYRDPEGSVWLRSHSLAGTNQGDSALWGTQGEEPVLAQSPSSLPLMRHPSRRGRPHFLFIFTAWAPGMGCLAPQAPPLIPTPQLPGQVKSGTAISTGESH